MILESLHTNTTGLIQPARQDRFPVTPNECNAKLIRAKNRLKYYNNPFRHHGKNVLFVVDIP